MKLALVVGSFYPAVIYGGPIFSTLNLGHGLSRLGVEVYVSTTDANGESRLDVPTGKFVTLGERFKVKYYGGADAKSFSWAYFAGLWRDLKHVDAVYLQPIFSVYVPLTLFYARIRKKPVLLSPRGSLGEWCLDSGSRLKRLWLALLIKPFSKGVVWHATSDQEAAEIASRFKNAKIRVVPNVVDISAPNPSRPEFLQKFAGSAKCEEIVASMGRLHAKKGFDILIDAFILLTKEFPRAALFIAGADFGEKAALSEKIAKAGLDGRVFLVGQLEGADKAHFLASADVFALSSHNENFGNVYAEALACGTPVVASKNTPWSEVEREGCGRWVENDAAAFARAISQILHSDAQMMGERGKKYVEERFGWRKIAADMQSILAEMAETT